LKHYKRNGAQTPTDKLRSSTVSEFSGAKVRTMVMPTYIGSDDQSSPNDFINEASDVIQTLNGAQMPTGGQVWPSSVGIAGLTIPSGETVIMRSAELYENSLTDPPDIFNGVLMIYDIQLFAASGTSTVTAYTTTSIGGDGKDPGTGFQNGPFYFFTQGQSVTSTAATAFTPSRTPPGWLPFPMGPYTDFVFVETGANDCSATIYYAVMSYGGGLA